VKLEEEKSTWSSQEKLGAYETGGSFFLGEEI